MIFDASTSFASTWRSLGESFEMSAVMSVGAKRAIICSMCAVSNCWRSFQRAPRMQHRVQPEESVR